MRKSFSALLVSTLVLTGCATVRDSRVNPFNWFGNARSESLTQAEVNTNPLIPTRSGLFASARAEEAVYTGRPFDQVTDLTIERVPGGALIRVTGLAARQGIYDVQLTPANEDELPVDGVLTYRLEGVEPARIIVSIPAWPSINGRMALFSPSGIVRAASTRTVG